MADGWDADFIRFCPPAMKVLPKLLPIALASLFLPSLHALNAPSADQVVPLPLTNKDEKAKGK
jgi:hypothetical protein